MFKFKGLILMNNITKKLKKRFCKDVNIPIILYDEPYFSDRLNLFSKHWKKLLKQWEIFRSELKFFKFEDEYFQYYSSFKEKVINYIKEKEEYKSFNSCDMNVFFKIPNYNIKSKTIFKDENVDKNFISIDLIKGNYSALKYYNPKLVDNTNNYEEFISQFTNSQHFINSKYIRQVIFGNCNPKRQITIEHYMMNIILKEILKKIELERIFLFLSDEIIIENFQKEDIDFIKNITKKYNFNVKIETFNLQKISDTNFYIKYFDNNKIEFKCVNALFMPMLLRKYYYNFIHSNDKIFEHEGYLVSFVGDMDLLEKNWVKNLNRKNLK